MSQNFMACIKFEVPPVFGKRWLGDGLLAGILYGKCRDPQRAIAELPLDHIEGIPQASEILPAYPSSPELSNLVFTKSFYRDLIHDHEMMGMLDKIPPKSYMTPAKGPFAIMMNRYKFRDVTTMYFLGRGDIDKVHRLLRSVNFIGAHKNSGQGQIKATDVWPVQTDNPWCGIIGSRNFQPMVLRPIPLRLKHLFPNDVRHTVADETWHNPYLPTYETSVIETCMVPAMMQGESFSEAEVEAMA